MRGSWAVRSIAARSWTARPTTSGSLRPLSDPGGLNTVMKEPNRRRPPWLPRKPASGTQSAAVPPNKPAGSGRLGQHVDDHDPAGEFGTPRRDHHRQRAAHRMADDRRSDQAPVGDVARDLVGEWGYDRAGAVAARRFAGEAGSLDQMVAVAGQSGDGPAPDGAARSQARDQDD